MTKSAPKPTIQNITTQRQEWKMVLSAQRVSYHIPEMKNTAIHISWEICFTNLNITSLRELRTIYAGRITSVVGLNAYPKTKATKMTGIKQSDVFIKFKNRFMERGFAEFNLLTVD